MGAIILIAIFAILALVILIKDRKNPEVNSVWAIGVVSVIIAGIGVFAVIYCSITLRSDFESYKNEYEVTKQLVESYKGGEFGNVNALSEKIIEVNDRIAKHKAYSDSFFVGWWYSEEIGNLQPITFNHDE